MWSIAFYTALRNIRDKRMLAIVLLAPIVLIVLLGTALEGLFAPREIEKSTIAYLNEDSSYESQQLTGYLLSETVAQFVNTVLVEDSEQGFAYVASGTAEAFVYVRNGFSQELVTSQGQIELYSTLQMPLIRGLLLSYTDSVNSMLVMTPLSNEHPLEYRSYVTEHAISPEGKAPRAMDYFAVQTLLQVMLMGGWYGIGSIQDDREKNTIVRLRTAPISPWQDLFGKVIANVLVLFAQSSLVVLFSMWVYKANWSGNALVIAATLMLFSAFTVALGVLVGTLTRDGNKGFGLLWGIMLFFSITAGAFGTTDLGIWARFSPNYYAKTALFGTIYGSAKGLVNGSLMTLLAATIACSVTALWLGRRKNA